MHNQHIYINIWGFFFRTTKMNDGILEPSWINFSSFGLVVITKSNTNTLKKEWAISLNIHEKANERKNNNNKILFWNGKCIEAIWTEYNVHTSGTFYIYQEPTIWVLCVRILREPSNWQCWCQVQFRIWKMNVCGMWRE